MRSRLACQQRGLQKRPRNRLRRAGSGSGPSTSRQDLPRVESPQVIGGITFWNTGSVTAHLIHTPSKKEYMLDDRQLTQSENVGTLMKSYFDKVIELER
jgi:hypothetical protein